MSPSRTKLVKNIKKRQFTKIAINAMQKSFTQKFKVGGHTISKERVLTIYHGLTQEELNGGSALYVSISIWVDDRFNPDNCVFRGSVKNYDELTQVLEMCFRDEKRFLEGLNLH